jgi:8-oxo-dGTP diphosphatase
VEPGESAVEELWRELREELGIDVVQCDDEPTSRLHLSANASDAAGAELHLSTWRVTSWRGEPTNVLEDEHERVAWFGAGVS